MERTPKSAKIVITRDDADLLQPVTDEVLNERGINAIDAALTEWLVLDERHPVCEIELPGLRRYSAG